MLHKSPQSRASSSLSRSIQQSCLYSPLFHVSFSRCHSQLRTVRSFCFGTKRNRYCSKQYRDKHRIGTMIIKTKFTPKILCPTRFHAFSISFVSLPISPSFPLPPLSLSLSLQYIGNKDNKAFIPPLCSWKHENSSCFFPECYQSADKKQTLSFSLYLPLSLSPSLYISSSAKL